MFDPQSTQGSDWPSGGASVDLGSCVIRTEVMTRENSIEVPRCHQTFLVTCLARSLSSCGLQCPLCNQSLAEFSRSSSFSASCLFHGCMIDVDRPSTKDEFSGSSRDASVPLAVELAHHPSLSRRTTAGRGGLHLLWHILPSGQLNGCALVVRERRTFRMFQPQIPSMSPGFEFAQHVVDVAASQHWFSCSRCQRRLEARVVEPPTPQGESAALPATT